MPNQPDKAAEKRPKPAQSRRNAQSDHEGSPHKPEEFLRPSHGKPAGKTDAPGKTGGRSRT